MKEQAPWLIQHHEALADRCVANTAPLLIYGKDLLGLEELTHNLLALNLCESPISGQACGVCTGCQLRLAGNHPDVHWIMPQDLALLRNLPVELKSGAKPSKEIRIDEIRQMQTFFNTASSRLGERWAVLIPFEAINLNAANALLKVLEEPPNGLRFILLGLRIEYLLPTILSRVQSYHVAPPRQEEAIVWLKGHGIDQPEVTLSLALGDPFEAHQMAQSQPDELSLRKKWIEWLSAEQRSNQPPVGIEKLTTDTWLDLMMALAYDVLAIQTGQRLKLFEWAQPKLVWTKRIDAARLSDLFQYLIGEKRLAKKPLNPRLALESASQRWHACCQ